MKKVFTSKFVLLFTIMIIITVSGFNCVEIPSTGPEIPELTAQYRFLNAASDLSEAIGLTVDDDPAGTIALNEATDFIEFNAGSRVVVLSTNDTLRVAMPTYQRGTVIILPKPDGQDYRNYLRLNDRRIFDNAEIDTGRIQIVNAVAEPEEGLIVSIFSADSSFTQTTTLEPGNGSNAFNFPFGDYTLNVVAADDTTATSIGQSTVTLANTRQTTVITGMNTNDISFVHLSDN